MTSTKGGDTVNSGPAPKRPDRAASDPVGNARERGEDPSPDNRERGETSARDEAARAKAATR